MPVLVNKETGEKEFFLDKDAGPLLKSGGYVAAEGERLSIVDEFGNYKNVDPETYVSYHSQIASSPAPQEMISDIKEEYRLQDKHDTIGQEILTGLEGAARGATFGASDVALRMLGADEENMRNRQRINSTIATGTELGGAILPGLLTGGTGAAGTAAKILSKTPSALVMKTGSRIAGNAGTSLVSKAAYGALGGAVEGAAFGAGQGISELALSNRPLSAERFVSTIGSEMLLGAALGGAVGGALPIAGAAASATGRATKKVAEKTVDYGTELAKKVGIKLDDYPTIKKLLGGTTEEIEEELLTFKTTLSSKLENFENGLIKEERHLLDDVSDLRKELPKLSASAGGTLDDTLVNDSIAKLDLRTQEFKDTQEKFYDIFGDIQDPSRDFFETLSKAEGGSLPKQVQAIDNYITSTKRLVDIQEKVAAAAGGKYTSRLPDIKATREALEALTSSASSAGDKIGTAELLVAADILGYDVTELPIIRSLPFAKEFIWLKAIHGRLKGSKGKKLLTKVGLGPKSKAGVAAKAGEADASSRKAISTFLKGPAKEAGKKTSGALNRSKVPATIEILNSTSFEPSEKKKYSAKTAQEAFKRRSEELMNMSTQPQRIQESVTRSMGDLPPDLLQEIIGVVTRKIQFLASKLPRDASQGRIIPKEYKPPSLELKKFSRYMRAAENPQTVLEDMKDGVLTQEGAETIKAVYPAFFADIQQQIVEGIIELKEQLGYKQRLQVSRLFGVPVDDSMEPEFIAMLQADFAPKEESSGGGGSFNVPAMEPTTADGLTSNKPGEF